MARINKKQKADRKGRQKITFDDVLPQNFLQIGDIEEDLNIRIYISQQTYKSIHMFTENKTKNESGGVLVGNVIEAFGKTNILIRDFLEAKYTQATPTTLTFTHETWGYIHEEIDKRYENGRIVGWIHTHPSFGVFLSEYDMFIQNNFFQGKDQVAYVVDPIQHTEGFFFNGGEKVDHCKGFYIFDAPGISINIMERKNEDNEFIQKKRPAESLSKSKPFIYACAGVLVLTIAALTFISLNLFNRLRVVETRLDNLSKTEERSTADIQREKPYRVYMIPSATSVKASPGETEKPKEISSDTKDSEEWITENKRYTPKKSDSGTNRSKQSYGWGDNVMNYFFDGVFPLWTWQQ